MRTGPRGRRGGAGHRPGPRLLRVHARRPGPADAVHAGRRMARLRAHDRPGTNRPGPHLRRARTRLGPAMTTAPRAGREQVVVANGVRLCLLTFGSPGPLLTNSWRRVTVMTAAPIRPRVAGSEGSRRVLAPWALATAVLTCQAIASLDSAIVKVAGRAQHPGPALKRPAPPAGVSFLLLRLCGCPVHWPELRAPAPFWRARAL